MRSRSGKGASKRLNSSSSPLSSPPAPTSPSPPPPSSASPSPSTSSPDSDKEDDMTTLKRATNLEARLNKAVAEVVSLHHSEWIAAAKILHAKVSRGRKGIRNIEVKLVAAGEVKAAEEDRIAKILRRGPDYGPYGAEKAFVTFKTRRIARLFRAKPEMLEHMKTQAQSASYNKGYKTKIKLYDEIAKDPEKVIAAAEAWCAKDETQGSSVEETDFTLMETLDAMDWYADNMHAKVSGIYEEYKDVPTKEMFESEKGRARNRSEGLNN